MSYKQMGVEPGVTKDLADGLEQVPFNTVSNPG